MLRKTLLVLAVLVSVSSLAQASFVSGPIVAPINNREVGFSLAQVIEAGGIRVGDKVFDMFSVNNSMSDGAQAPNPDGIIVYGVQINGELGLRFTGGWSADARQVADTVIVFRVTADQGWKITDNSLWMDAYGAAAGGLVTISENVYASDPLLGSNPALANKSVKFSNRVENKLYDHQEFSDEQGNLVAMQQIWVVKDITVSGGPGTGYAMLSQFYQTFSQIPEPASVILLAMGGLIALVRKGRRS